MTASTQAGCLPLDAPRESQAMAALKANVCDQIQRSCVQEYGRRLAAILLTGSLAREEATVIAEAQRSHLLGDADFVLLFDRHSPLPSSPDVEGLRRQIEAALLERNMLCHITLSAVHPSYLRKLPPTIFSYELQACGQVVWGEPETLSLIPTFSPREIPLEDAWRLLSNRMIEHLETVEERADAAATLSPAAHYRTVKLYLDMATSFLLFAGAYAPTYRERARCLARLAEALPREQAPFPLPHFAETVAACTRWKLCPAEADDRVDWEFWDEAVAYARRLWRWELERLTGASANASDQELRQRWMRCQPVHRRLRGWLYVLRKHGWHRSWLHWPQWTRLAWRASPRDWVYAAASELFFRLPDLLSRAGRQPVQDLDWEQVKRWLPVSRHEPATQLPPWGRLAQEIVWNYQEFLEGTRA